MAAWQCIKDSIEISGTLATLIVAWLVYRTQKQRDKFDRNLEKPYLNIINIQGKGWALMNIGQGPALKVRFADNDGNWKQPVIGYAVPPNTALLIMPEIQHGNAIAATYADLMNTEYIAYTAGDTTTVNEKGHDGWDQNLCTFLQTDVRRSNNLTLITF